MTQSELARRTRISFARVNDLLHGRRGLSLDTARRLARFFGISTEFWMNLQLRWDLYHAEHEKDEAIERIEPFDAHVVSFGDLVGCGWIQSRRYDSDRRSERPLEAVIQREAHTPRKRKKAR